MACRALRDAQRMASNYAEDLYVDLESWKKDHSEAMRCLDLEERLALLNGLLELVLRVRARYDSIVLAEALDYDSVIEQADRRIEEEFERISTSCREIDSRIKGFETQGFGVDGSTEFRVLRGRMDVIVAEAGRIASIEGRVGFRGVEMAPEAASHFREMLDAHVRSQIATTNQVQPAD